MAYGIFLSNMAIMTIPPQYPQHLGWAIANKDWAGRLETGLEEMFDKKPTRLRNLEVLGGSSQDLDAWLVTMVIVGTSPKDRVVGPLTNGLNGL